MSNEVTKKETTEIAEVKSGFLSLENFDLASAIAEEMDGLSITFDRIKLPAGFWKCLERKSQLVKQFCLRR